MFSYFIRFSLLVVFCLLFGSFQSFAVFPEEMEEVLRKVHSTIPPATTKTVESLPLKEQVPLIFTVKLPEIRELPPAEGNRFFDDATEQEKHSIYQFSLKFNGLAPSDISYLDKESSRRQKVKIENRLIGFLDIKIIYNKETGQRIAYLDEVNFEPHVQGIGLGHIALTFFAQFVDTLKCDLSFLKLLSNEAHTCALYERYGFVFTQRSLDKLEMCRFGLGETRENSGAAVSAVMEKYSPLKMVRLSERNYAQLSSAECAEAEPLSPSKTLEVNTSTSPISPLKLKARRRLALEECVEDANCDRDAKENSLVVVAGS